MNGFYKAFVNMLIFINSISHSFLVIFMKKKPSVCSNEYFLMLSGGADITVTERIMINDLRYN